MNTAQKIIAKFGGQVNVAELIGKGQSTVAYWAKTGVIPIKWRANLLQIASEKGISLSSTDFDTTIQIINDKNELETQKASHFGALTLGNEEIPCYVLESGERIFSLKGVVVALTGVEGGQLAEYIKVKSIRSYLPEDLIPAENGQIPALLNFDTGAASFAKTAIGVPVERFMDICIAYSTALQESDKKDGMVKLTDRQKEIAERANSFLRACAKTGIIALVDEATGYQYDRPIDALQFKLNLFLAEELRKWEKTFPDQLWVEFGRLTNWKGSLQQRPKYWGKLVNELVYSYLDKDVYEWLNKNVPTPTKSGISYHRWLTEQYGLKKLLEHIWQLVGMASACTTMEELRRKMAEKYGRIPIQLSLFVPPH
ncbi:hypothetical protein HYN49_13410 [Flavobacterium pallidum]|uniref:Bacteriophage Mx8 p63 C-terminal domain-containing protein n=2 Tax=Flavobacterium pallidum TaxID=2172098 RepID=A0A2S1SLP1_9FLAO|nr:hypothetical protein HYN49_13410 [Flavobacterium pallidum]